MTFIEESRRHHRHYVFTCCQPEIVCLFFAEIYGHWDTCNYGSIHALG